MRTVLRHARDLSSVSTRKDLTIVSKALPNVALENTAIYN